MRDRLNEIIDEYQDTEVLDYDERAEVNEEALENEEQED